MEEHKNDTFSRAVSLLQQRPPLSFAVIGRQLGVTRERIRQISEACGEGKLRRRESAVLRRVINLQRRDKVSRAVVQCAVNDLRPAELSEWVTSVAKRRGDGLTDAQLKERVQTVVESAGK